MLLRQQSTIRLGLRACRPLITATPLRKMSLITLSTGAAGYLVGKEDSSAGLIVIQEWWGLNDQIKGIATRFSEQGFLALSPDLYHGKVATEADEAKHLLTSLDWQGAVKDIKAAVEFLQSKGVKKIGVTGFCMGGAATVAAAVLIDGVNAGVVYYGVPSRQLADPTKTRVPLQLHFGDRDDAKGFSDPEAADQLEADLKVAGVEYERYRYDAGHAFLNETGPNYNKELAALAFERSVAFFNKHLKN